MAEKVERISFNESNIVLGSVWKNQGKAEAKFDHFKGIVGGEVYDPLPIRFLRISELTILGDMLKQAMQFAAAAAVEDYKASLRIAEQQAGVERHARANAALIENEKFGRKW